MAYILDKIATSWQSNSKNHSTFLSKSSEVIKTLSKAMIHRTLRSKQPFLMFSEDVTTNSLQLSSKTKS